MRRASLAVAPLALLLLLSAISPPGSAGIGSGSKMMVESQTQMLLQQGGGYVNWEISGPVATDVRRNVDRGFGDGDGIVTHAEASSYTNEIDLLLENYIFYGSAHIIRSSLLNKDIATDTAGLIGPVNSTKAVEIHFTFSANLRNEGAAVNFGDQRIPSAAFRALKGEANQSFEGELSWRHTEIIVGMGSVSGTNADRGSFSRFRGPGFEVLWYSLGVQNQTSNDQARFDTFNVVQCPLELFVVVCVFGVFTLWFPRHFSRAKKMLKVRWLHLLMILLVVAEMALFFTGADGAVIWTVSPLLAVLSYVLSWGIYSAGWKGIAKSSVPVVPVRPVAPSPGPVSPLQRVTTAKQWAEHLPEIEGEPIPVAAASPANRAVSGPPSSPVAQAAAFSRRDLRCPRCKGTFPVDDPGTRPLAIKCTLCGAEGVLRK